jgi:sec-independent protein translocase protein TatC
LFFIIGIILANPVIDKIQNDLLTDITVITISPLEYFYTQIKVAFLISVLFSFPILVFEFIGFVKPALKRKEKVALLYILPGILLLFAAGVIFSYVLVLPLAIRFFGSLAVQAGVENFWTVARFLGFVLITSIMFGLVFQLPILLLTLSKLNIISARFLENKRKYVYLILFIAAAIFTPPDALTLMLAVIPLLLLYELSYLLIRWI